MAPMKAVKKLALEKKFSHLSKAELDLLEKHYNNGKTATQVADALSRDLSSVDRHFKRLDAGDAAPKKGRPNSLTTEQEKQVVKTAEELIRAAKSEWGVTAAMVREALKLKCCDRVILEVLHKRGIWFHSMREKPVRTEDDEKDRRKFGARYEKKPASFWSETVDGFLDNKFFPIYLNEKGRAFARKRSARGSFRARGKGMGDDHTKPSKSANGGFGKGILVSVAICAKKVLMCHIVKGKWSGQAAADMYTKKLGPALRRMKPSKRRFFGT